MERLSKSAGGRRIVEASTISTDNDANAVRESLISNGITHLDS